MKIDETTNRLLFTEGSKYTNTDKKALLQFINQAKDIIISRYENSTNTSILTLNNSQQTNMVIGAPHFVQATDSYPEKHVNPAEFNYRTKLIVFNSIYSDRGLTNENNKEGNKIKVILISKAGSEGIDFKFIRQVHILEPWYNMNRIEQIIGRADRNFSHKDLPFEKRNVEIFMYGTILGDNKEEVIEELLSPGLE
jgi:superfamily II DNA or RNA helicase